MKINQNGEIVGLPKIRYWFDETDPTPSCSGDGKAYTFDWEYSDKDKCFIPKKGKDLDLYGMIQLHKDSTDLSNIIARVKAGDIGALNVRSGEYMDVTEAPRSLNDLAAFNARVDKSWDDLDPKVREIFGNDISKFTNALISGDISKAINDYMNNAAAAEVKGDSTNE